MKEAIEQVIKLWEDATGENVKERKTRISLGRHHDFTLHEAMNCLDEDPTGLLAALKLRQAFKEFIDEASISATDFLDDGIFEFREKLVKLKSSLHSGVIGDTYNEFVKSLLKNIKAFGKKFTEEQFNNIEKIEDVLVKAVVNFNKPYEFRHERFTEGELKKQDARILKRLFRFNSFEDFVDSLKATTENNFVCVALCDRTFRENDGSEYDKKYDSQFVIGLKNNGAVITISDRKVLDSPSGEYKGRNPGREFFNKVDFSYLPYYKIEDIEDATEGKQQLRLTYKEEINSNDGQSVVDLFDDVGIVYITTLLTLVYNKYFTHPENDKVEEIQFFGKDIKLLPASSSKELMVVDGKLELPAVPKDSNYTTYLKDPKDEYGIHNTGIYDWLLEEYPLPEEVMKSPVKFIGTKEQAQRNVWWQVRNAQHEHIQKCIEDGYNRHDTEHWFYEQAQKNIESLLDFMLKTPEYDNMNNYKLSDWNEKDRNSNKPFIWKCYKDGIDMDLSSLRETGEENYCENKRYRYKPDYSPRYSIDTPLGKVYGTYYYSYEPVMWFANDNDQRFYELTLTLRSWSDLKKFFKLEELPKELKRWLNMRANSWSTWAWEPNSGNSILNFTDPMNRMKIPQNDIRFVVKLELSKTMYNKIKKLQKSSEI